MKHKKQYDFPSAEQLRQELQHERYRRKYRSTLSSTVSMLLMVAAVAVLIAMLWMPVLEAYGSSMSPTLEQGDIVLCIKTRRIRRGDLTAFYYGNKLLIKRCIALPGDMVFIDADGNVSVNNEPLDEPYITEKTLGDSDIHYPLSIPQEKYFVMGDHRFTSVDSRNSEIGCISNEQLIGRVVFRIWPIKNIGRIGVD